LKALGVYLSGDLFSWVQIEGSSKKILIKGLGVNKIGKSPEVNAQDSKSVEIEDPPQSNRIAFGLPSRMCSLREIKIPFIGKEEIQRTLKFESESYFQGYSIEDIIVDGFVVEESEGETRLFVSSCPKSIIKEFLFSLSSNGVDPELVSLDMELLALASIQLGALSTGQPSTDLIVSIEKDSTIIGLIDNGKLESIRTIRFGVDKIEKQIAKKTGVPLEDVRVFFQEYPQDLKSAKNSIEKVVDSGAAGFQNESYKGNKIDSVKEKFKNNKLIGDVLDGVVSDFCLHLQKEIYKFLAGGTGALYPVNIFLSGWGLTIPTLKDCAINAFSGKAFLLNLFNRIDSQYGWYPEKETALAAAMGAMGIIHPQTNYRKEEFRFRKKFDRIKTPLAIFIFLLTVFVLYADLNILNGIKTVEEGIGVAIAQRRKGRRISKQLPRYTGLLYQIALPDPRRGHVKAYLPSKVSDNILKKIKNSTPRNRVKILLNELKRYRKKLETQTGYFPELKLESGLAVLVWFSRIIKRANEDPGIANFLVVSIELRVGVKKSYRYLEAKVVFRGDNFRDQAALFMKKMDQVSAEDGSPFSGFEEKGGGKPFQNSVTTGAEYIFRINLKDEIPVNQKIDKRGE